jgi:hypothetical protein
MPRSVVRIEQPESEADDGGDRGQRDVALGEIQPQPDDLAALPFAPANHAGVGQGGGIGAGPGAGEREAGNLAAVG